MVPKISIVIPVYNAEHYLQKCLDSVLGQSLQDIEVICVDDGSSDNSKKILEENAKRDDRICIIKQTNCGAGNARNNGLLRATGEYVLFLDGDDTIIDNNLEKLWKEAHKKSLEVLRCRAVDYDNQTGLITHSVHNYLKRVPSFLFHIPIQYLKAWPIFPRVNVAPWGGIFQRKFLMDKSIRFNNLTCVNDRSFFWEAVLKSQRIAFTDVVLVKYRMSLPESLVSRRIQYFDCHFKSYELVFELSRAFPSYCQRSILNGELLDIANWLKNAMKTEFGILILSKTEDFIENMDKRPWNEHVEQTRWYKRIQSCKRKA